MKSLLPLLVGVLLGLGWIAYCVRSPWFSDGVEDYGFESTGLCMGGPALVLMLIGMFTAMIMEERAVSKRRGEGER